MILRFSFFFCILHLFVIFNQILFTKGEATVDEEPVESSQEEFLEESLIALPTVESAQKKRLQAARERVASYCHADFDTWPFLRERWPYHFFKKKPKIDTLDALDDEMTSILNTL